MFLTHARVQHLKRVYIRIYKNTPKNDDDKK